MRSIRMEERRFLLHYIRRYPNIVKDLKERPAKYNESMQKLFRLEKEGRVFVIAPDTTHGVEQNRK